MNSRERVVRTIKFGNPDRIPIDLWVHGATSLKYGDKLNNILQKHPLDILRVFGPNDFAFYPESYKLGEHVDEWGSTWLVLQEGMLGEVKNPGIKEITEVNEYLMPYDNLHKDWNQRGNEVDDIIQDGINKGQFITGGYVQIFERMQFIRGTENLFYDLGLEIENVMILRDKLVEYFEEYLKYWLDRDVDAILFSDDWGSQRSLLISPDMWRLVFKPAYKKLFNIVKEAGKYIFFHSCGNTLQLLDDFINLGVDAINTQATCLFLDEVAEKCAGKITLWGELDRQTTLSTGTPDDICKDAAAMKDKLFVNGGGLIGQCVVGKDVTLENIEAALTCWNN